MNIDDGERATDIIVNGRPKTVEGRDVTFDQIVSLAFENPPHGADTIFSVTYRKGGNEHRPEGVMVEGDTVKIKKGTTFNVSATNRS
jgi:Multiubiquitin